MRIEDLFENELNRIWDKAIEMTEKEAVQIVQKNWDKFCPRVINNGFCDIFAYKVKDLIPSIEIYETNASDGSGTFGHVIFKYKNKFFDAETKNGVSNTNLIPYSKRAFELNGEYPKYEKI